MAVLLLAFWLGPQSGVSTKPASGLVGSESNAPARAAVARDGAEAPARMPTASPHGPSLTSCNDCHTASGWKPLRNILEFDHNKTAFPLRQLHAGVGCTQCHTKLVFNKADSHCATCHADLHRGQMSTQCERCHTTKGWRESVTQLQSHQNRFPLLGGHATVDCESCHKNAAVGQFQGLSTDCFSCHAGTFQATNSPSHRAIGFPTDCRQCHTADTWLNAHFDHAAFTGFPLTGAHAQAPCISCHTGGNFTLTGVNCINCHLNDYKGTTNPNHIQGNFPQQCSLCHGTTTWANATFNHSSSAFPLTGAHAQQPCSACHGNGQYAGLSTACISCHLANYNSTTNPKHAAAGFPQQCNICHNTTSWAGAAFAHNLGPFTLTGFHATLPCSACHSSGVYVGLNTACVSCHLANYNSTTNPNHASAGFPQDCSICHSTTSWAGAVFNHNNTPFPLTGAHASQPCAACHSSGVYVGLNTACVSCHLANYNGTTNPNHVSAGFPQQCNICHNTTSWAGATFNHANTPFPLTGAHLNVPCSSCHVNNVYVGTPTDCYSCHKSQYTGTTNPNHVAAGFPTTCNTCHTTTAWTGATFNHTWFPSNHNGATCADCHINPNDYSVFSCIGCHQPQSRYDSIHSGIRNYVYSPTSCYGCHPQGRAG